MDEFRLKGETIDLVQLLKAAHLCGSGGEAKMIIEDGLVMVDGEIETRKRKKIRAGQTVEFNNEKISVVST